MNNKVSSVQVAMMFTLVCSSLYLGLGDILILRLSYNTTLIAMLIGSILGLIPIFLYIKINNYYPKLNIYKKNMKFFGKTFGYIINVLFYLIYFALLILSLRSMIIFTTSKYLQETPYYVVGLLIITTVFFISKKKLETLTRLSQILFFLTIFLVLFIEIFLVKYIEIDNVLPMFTNNTVEKVINGSIFYASITSLNSILLLSISKNEISDIKNYSKNIIIFYLIGTLSLTIVMFFVISCFGYDMATMFRYPEYILLKKIIVSNTDLHIENFLAFRWLFYMISQANIATYCLSKGLNEIKLSEKKQSIILFIILLIAMYLSRNMFKSVPNSIVLFKNSYIPFVAIPIITLMLIIYIRTLFIKKRT